MSRSRLWPIGLSLAAVLALSVGAVAGGKGDKSADEFFDVDDVKPGMKGHGVTVFSGTELEHFDVEVISVLHDFLPDQDLILARCSHPVLDHAGVIAGMSGSPIYFDGRLAGAVAYAWRFAKDPIAGITPAKDMAAYLDLPAMPPGVGVGTDKLLMDGSQQGVGSAPALPSFWDRFDMESSQMVPLATPVHGGGPLFGRFISSLQPTMKSHFMVAAPPMPSAGKGKGGKGKSSPSSPPFRPGDPIAVQLVGGDLDMAATGTVTMVKGSKALGFGHPMFNWGAVRFPAARARIHHCLASEAFSFKMSETLDPAGAIVHDRQAGILADVDADPMTIDLDIDLADSTRGMHQSWNMDVAHHPQISAGLIRSALTSAVDHFALEVVDTVVDGRYAIEIEGHDTLEFRQKIFLSTGTLSLAYSQRLSEALGIIMKSSFETPRVQRVKVDIDLEYGNDVAAITGAWPEKDEVEEGEMVRVWVIIDPHQGPEMTLSFDVEVPSGTAGKTLKVSIKPGGMVIPETVQPESLDDVIDNLGKGWQSDKAVAEVQVPSGGLTIQGQHIPMLPISALSTLQPKVAALDATPLATLERYFITTPYLLDGSVTLSINVKAK